MEQGEQDINIERQKFIEKLKANVNTAFNNRVMTNLVGEANNLSTTQGIENGKRLASEMAGLQGNEKLPQDYIDHLEATAVHVENPHDYRDLLVLGFERMAEVGVWDMVNTPHGLKELQNMNLNML